MSSGRDVAFAKALANTCSTQKNCHNYYLHTHSLTYIEAQSEETVGREDHPVCRNLESSGPGIWQLRNLGVPEAP